MPTHSNIRFRAWFVGHARCAPRHSLSSFRGMFRRTKELTSRYKLAQLKKLTMFYENNVPRFPYNAKAHGCNDSIKHRARGLRSTGQARSLAQMLLLLCVSSWRARASHGAGSAAPRARDKKNGSFLNSLTAQCPSQGK